MLRTIAPIILLYLLNACAPRAFFLDHPKLVSIYFNQKISKLEKLPTRDLETSRELLRTKVEFAFGILMEESDRLINDDYEAGVEGYKSAFVVFKEAKQIGFNNLLLKYPNFDDWLSGNSEIEFHKSDIFDLYWYAAAIGGAVKSSRGNPFELIHLNKVHKLLKVALSLNPNWGQGALYSAMLSYTTSRNDLSNSALLDSANFYYEKAIIASDSLNAGIFVNYAEAIDRKFQRKDEFEEKLFHVLNMELDSDSNLYLGNLIAKNRAEWLLSKKGDYFLE